MISSESSSVSSFRAYEYDNPCLATRCRRSGRRLSDLDSASQLAASFARDYSAGENLAGTIHCEPPWNSTATSRDPRDAIAATGDRRHTPRPLHHMFLGKILGKSKKVTGNEDPPLSKTGKSGGRQDRRGTTGRRRRGGERDIGAEAGRAVRQSPPSGMGEAARGGVAAGRAGGRRRGAGGAPREDRF